MSFDPIFISLRVAAFAVAVVMVLSIFLGRLFTEKDFRFKNQVESLIVLPMVLPPTIIGYGLLLLLGRNGPLGRLMYELTGQTVIFTWWAGVVASSVVALPLMYQSFKGALLDVDEDYIKAARTMGLTENWIFWKIKLPLARQGLITGVALAFARAIGEFGATLMIAGNIPGRTQTIPIAIYFAVESGDYRTANLFLGVIVIISLVLVYLINRRRKVGV